MKTTNNYQMKKIIKPLIIGSLIICGGILIFEISSPRKLLGEQKKGDIPIDSIVFMYHDIGFNYTRRIWVEADGFIKESPQGYVVKKGNSTINQLYQRIINGKAEMSPGPVVNTYIMCLFCHNMSIDTLLLGNYGGCSYKFNNQYYQGDYQLYSDIIKQIPNWKHIFYFQRDVFIME